MGDSESLSIRFLQLFLAVCLGLSVSLAPVPAELTTLFSLKTFVRGKGKPVAYTRDFLKPQTATITGYSRTADVAPARYWSPWPSAWTLKL